MQDLIDKLEKAGGPDRELDALIWLRIPKIITSDPVPNYTGSIDAALMLVPRYHRWELRQGIEARAVVWRLETDYDEHGAPTGYSTVFPAIALCIAALKARGGQSA